MRGTPAFGFTQSGRCGARGDELGDDAVGVGERPAAVGAERGHAERLDGRDDVGRAHAHHRPRALVEAERRDERKVGHALHALDRPERFLEREERLEHEQVDAAVGERACLLGESLDRGVVAEQPVRLDELTRRSDRAGHEPLVADRLARELGRTHVHLARATGERAVGQAQAGPAEGAGQDEIRSGVGKAAVQLPHPVRRVEHPFLRRDAGLDPHALVVRAGGAVREQDAAVGEQFSEGWHRRSLCSRAATRQGGWRRRTPSSTPRTRGSGTGRTRRCAAPR